MNKTLVALLLLTALPAEARNSLPVTWASPAMVAEACLPATCGVAPIADLYQPLLVPRILAGGFGGSGSGGGTVPDPIVPIDGTQNITGALSVSGSVTVTGVSQFVSQIGFTKGPGLSQMSFDDLYTGDVTLEGNVANTGVLSAVNFNATTALTSGRFISSFANGGVIKFQVNYAGALIPGVDISGSGPISWTSGPKTYVIDFAAFNAGVNDTSAQTMTGVLMGDSCTVSSATDLSASIGQLTARPTSSGNIIIIASGVSTVSTANPASDTFTVRCER